MYVCIFWGARTVAFITFLKVEYVSQKTIKHRVWVTKLWRHNILVVSFLVPTCGCMEGTKVYLLLKIIVEL